MISLSFHYSELQCYQEELTTLMPQNERAFSRSPQKVLFDSLTVHFSLSIFLEQFFNHLLFPLLLPWMVYQHGWNCLVAQGFLPYRMNAKDILVTCWHWCSPFLFYNMLYESLLGNSSMHMSVLIPTMLYCLHRTMVALKYATLSDSELRRLLRVRFNKRYHYYMNSTSHILSL